MVNASPSGDKKYRYARVSEPLARGSAAFLWDPRWKPEIQGHSRGAGPCRSSSPPLAREERLVTRHSPGKHTCLGRSSFQTGQSTSPKPLPLSRFARHTEIFFLSLERRQDGACDLLEEVTAFIVGNILQL